MHLRNQILVLCLFLLFLNGGCATAEQGASADLPGNIPEEVTDLFENYILANRIGIEEAVEAMRCEDYFLEEEILQPKDHLIDYRLESWEKINDRLYAVSFWVKSRNSTVLKGADVYRLFRNFVCSEEGEWRYLNGVGHIPADLRADLMEKWYMTDQPEAVFPEAERSYQAEPEDIPEEVIELLENYMHAYALGSEYAVEYAHYEVEFVRRAFARANEHLLDYRVERIEKVNDNLYSLTLWLKSKFQVMRKGDGFEKAYSFICNIDGQWYFAGGVAQIPPTLRENLDESRYTIENPDIVPYEDIIGFTG